jgi:hypothetical protein
MAMRSSLFHATFLSDEDPEAYLLISKLIRGEENQLDATQ